jgi:hypothetical protein
VHQLAKNRIGYPSRVFKEHINFDKIVLQPKTWRPDVIEVCPIFYYSHFTTILKGDTKASYEAGIKIVQNKTEICLFNPYPQVI